MREGFCATVLLHKKKSALRNLLSEYVLYTEQLLEPIVKKPQNPFLPIWKWRFYIAQYVLCVQDL